MKIVIASAIYYPQINGVAVFAHNLAMGLKKRGHEVIVICPSQTGKKHIEDEDGVKVYYLKSTTVKVYPDQIHDAKLKKGIFYRYGFKISVAPKRAVNKILKEFNPDVVHVQVSDMIGVSVVAYAKKHNIPVVTTEHNQPEVLTEPLHMPKMARRPIEAALSRYFISRQAKSDYVTMPTQLAIDNLFKKHKIDVPVEAVSNGVMLDNFKPGKASKEIYKKYQIPENHKIVLYVGRVDPEKQVGLILEAFLNSVVKNTTLVIVGDGVDRSRLEKIAKEKNATNVRFLGRVVAPDLYELYKVGDIFATASEIETQGIVLIEAAAVGLPLIAVNAGAVADVVRNGENGFLCEPGSVEELKNAMIDLLSDDKKRKEYSKKSLEIAKEHDFEKTLDNFEKIYQKVIKK